MGDGKRTREFNAPAKRHCMSQRGSTDLFIEVKNLVVGIS
jgi:hypothetical protein